MPELLKKMYDYRMAIENMRVEVTVTKPVDTHQPHRETEKQLFYFVYDKGRVRCDQTFSNPKFPKKWFYQHLSTPDFYFTRHPSEVPEVNDGNSLFVRFPLEQPFDTLDPRRIGVNRNSFDTLKITQFNYDAILDDLYPARGEDFNVSIDMLDGEKLYKISYRINEGNILSSYWINPQKGYNLVRSESESQSHNRYYSYDVTLDKLPASRGEIWFPRQIVYKHTIKNNILEERIIFDSVAFDVQDEKPFTLADLKIPVGYRVEYFSEGARYWDGKELVDQITFPIEPVSITSRKVFWIVNAVLLILLAFHFLYKFFRHRNN